MSYAMIIDLVQPFELTFRTSRTGYLVDCAGCV
jgi:hypothetical protein